MYVSDGNVRCFLASVSYLLVKISMISIQSIEKLFSKDFFVHASFFLCLKNHLYCRRPKGQREEKGLRTDLLEEKRLKSVPFIFIRTKVQEQLRISHVAHK